MKHTEFETLINYFEGKLSAAETEKVSAHFLVCENCTAQSRKLENFLGYVRMHEYEQVSQRATANLLNIYKPKKQAVKSKSFIKKLSAKLVFDDWKTVLNERFMMSDTRQLLYNTDDFDIDLRLNFSGEKCQVSGQILPDCQNATVEIFSAESSEKVSLNQDCEFIFPPVKIGIYGLRISSADTLIEIRNISLLIS
jgi:hypothetical protein